MDLANVFACVSCGIALLSVIVSAYAVVQSRKTALTGTYFSEIASVYAEFLRCSGNFVFRKGSPERDALVSALYRLQLFASEQIAGEAQELYLALLEWAASGASRALELDYKLNRLSTLMQADLDHFRKKGHH